MLSYPMLKHAHMGFAYLSILLFTLRGLLLWLRPEKLAWRPLRILPHVIDTLLLSCALGLLWLGHWAVLQTPWILAKIGALLLYIGLGTVALKRGKTRTVRLVACAAALLVVIYIVLVAKTKLAWPL